MYKSVCTIIEMHVVTANMRKTKTISWPLQIYLFRSDGKCKNITGSIIVILERAVVIVTFRSRLKFKFFISQNVTFLYKYLRVSNVPIADGCSASSVCDQLCVDVVQYGGHVCGCEVGYFLQADGFTCAGEAPL